MAEDLGRAWRITLAGGPGAVPRRSGARPLGHGVLPPEAAAGGVIALVEDGDTIVIDIPNRSIRLDVPRAVLAERRARLEEAGGYRPRRRDRVVSTALRAYASMALSADEGAVREVN
jgi:dihydroxy-acid dehydratase